MPHPKPGCAVQFFSQAGSRSFLPAGTFPRCPQRRGAAGVAGAQLQAGAAAAFHVSPPA